MGEYEEGMGWGQGELTGLEGSSGRYPNELPLWTDRGAHSA